MASNPAQTIYVGGSNQPTPQQFQQPPTVNQQSQQPPAANQQLPDQNAAINAILNSEQTPPGPVFFKILDIATEWQRGNFLPALHCLRYNLIPKDYLDPTGYSVLHHAVSQGAVPIALILLDYFKMDVNIRSGNGQTPLMIACNYGLIDIIRILVERGAFMNEQDDTKFSALLYSVKQGRVPQFAYLLHEKADIQVRDTNGCSAVHWAAYKNNVFFLKVLHKLGLDLNAPDFTGLTPLDRATQGGAFEATKFLLENGDGKKPPNLKFDQVPSDDIKLLLRKKYYPTVLERLSGWTKGLIQKHSQGLTAIAYIVLWCSMMAVFLHQVVNKLFTFDLTFFLFSVFFICYALWYYLKSHGTSGKTKVHAYKNLDTTSLDETLNTTITRSPSLPRCNFEALDRLVKGEYKGSVVHEGESEGYASFLHELAAHFEAKHYKEIARFNEKDFCATCLIRKPARTGHCEETGVCVSNFQHYSPCLKTTINDKDHHLYLFLLTLQGIQITLFMFGLWVSYADALDKNKKVFAIYAGSLLYNDFGYLYAGIYAVLFVVWLYNTAFWLIEVYGVLKNETHYEMFNRTICNYLLRVKQDQKGGFIKSFKNPYDHGKMNNLKEYFGKIMHLDAKY